MRAYSLYLRLLGLVYVAAFLSLYYQWRGLYGYNGLLPADSFVAAVQQAIDLDDAEYTLWFLKFPSLLLLYKNLFVTFDSLATFLLLIGIFSSSLICIGFLNAILFSMCWVVYLSLCLVGQTFLSFQWDILLLECGFLSILMTPFLSYKAHPDLSLTWCGRFLAWKLMFLSGVVKLQSRCPTWNHLTALEYHFATQCIPTPVSWWAHQAIPLFLRVSVAATLLIEIPLTVLLILPFRNSRRIGALFQITLQVLIIITGNYNFFNILTIGLMVLVWADDYIDSRHTFDTFHHDLIHCDEGSGSCFKIFIQQKHSFTWSHLNEEGPFVMLMSACRMLDDSKWGAVLQYLLIIFFACYSTSAMFSIQSSNGQQNNPLSIYDTVVTGNWENIKIDFKMTYEQLQTYLLPSSLFAIGSCTVCSACCSVIHLRHCYNTTLIHPQKQIISTDKAPMQSMNSLGRMRRLLVWLSTAGLLIGRLSKCLLVGLFAVTWILVSSVPLRNVSEIQPYLPRFILSIEEQTRMLHINSGYGLFRRMTGVGKYQGNSSISYGGLTPTVVARPEVVLEGFDAVVQEWREIHFRYKPTDLYQISPYILPHQPRLDWQMWFAALGTYQSNPWLVHLVYKLLDKNQSTDIIPLLDQERYSFLEDPPASIRAWLYDYDFTRLNTSWARLNPTAAILSENPKKWWTRRNAREYLPAIEGSNPSLRAFLDAHRLKRRPYLPREKQVKKCLRLLERMDSSGVSPALLHVVTHPWYRSFTWMVCSSLNLQEYGTSIFWTIFSITTFRIIFESVGMK